MDAIEALLVSRLETDGDAHACADLMCTTDPWVTLGRDRAGCLRAIQDPTRETHLIRHDGRLVGFIVLCMTGPLAGYVQSVCVAPAWRGRGLGTRLIGFAEERIARESPNVFLCVSSFNRAAQRLYARLGYEVVGELRDYIVRGHSEILMRKSRGPISEWSR